MENYPQIVEGYVSHERVSPRAHALTSKTFYLRIPIRSVLLNTEGRQSSYGNWIFGINRKSLISIHDKDHGSGNNIKSWLSETLKKNTLKDVVDGEIWLVCFPRVMGYQFKPVSFWFCENSNRELVAVLAEVHNTFGERHTYILKPEIGRRRFDSGDVISTPKSFYVSPFLSVKGHYQFQFNYNPTTHRDFSRIDYYTDELILKTYMTGIAVPLTNLSALKAILKYPFITLKIIIQIHCNALILWVKKIPLTLSERNK
ncbi:MAG: DUF1365 domain-containing protein [Burkholderiales bacterium]|nr:DUF1365 domain-containing protein [Burkholderiales bacterium]OUT78671.1 MAG: hypothetical protein CBB82_02190 [Betaproteobacteria bacterium TMED22]|tara:strand:- start:17311 stop:18084 length:774 start_codon:yes stop_codon:yes gene_type:complete